MKIAISGKGGVGKTTLSSGLARLWAEEGRRVVAIDADPDANLAIALGADAATEAACVPLSHWDDLIEERTGARPGAGGMFRLNPEVADVVEMCGTDIGGVTLLKMGTVERGGAGCMCAEGTFLKAFLQHLLVQRGDVAILDMEAGIEHLGRGTAEGVDVFVVVVEPGSRSVHTAAAVHALARDIGVRDVVAVANKVRDASDAEYLREALGDIPLLGVLPESDGVRRADREGASPYEADPAFSEALRGIAHALEERIGEK
ncbi:MAG: carbon monoxide dehydrogenase [Coriobacteriaceae bacterium]|nr:carbon monoxide dehydrogenase [Coriobacteriaceae bacterium]